VSQTINWKHGFLRLWAVVSILWLGTVSIFVVLDHSWQEPSSLIDDLPSEDDLCGYQDTDGMHVSMCTPEAIAKGFAPLTPAEKHVQTVGEFMAQRKERLWKRRWKLITQNLPVAFGPPFALLLCGVAISWIIRGFTAR